MPVMSNHHLARIEAQLERLIEGTFTQIFRQRISGHELLLHITRAFDDHLAESTQADDLRPVAPDKFTIYLNPDIIPHIAKDEPHLIALLSEHISELATSHDYRLLRVPSIVLLPDADLSPSEVIVDATHQARPSQETSSLQRIELPPASQSAPIGRLIINGEQTATLGETVTNVGRSRDNDIVLTEPTVSRHHAQVRLRFGAYTLFDNDSQHGTYVNEIRIREHRLQPGDVILMGNARMIYVEDNEQADYGQTDIYPPLRS
jgi:hypothetical protein